MTSRLNPGSRPLGSARGTIALRSASGFGLSSDGKTTISTHRLVVVLPLPPSALSPNGSRGHWSKHAKAARDYRFACYLAGRDIRRDHDYAAATISMAFEFCYGRRAWDADNCLAAAKPAIDALRDLGILRSDSARFVRYGAVSSEHHKRGCRCDGQLVVTLEETAS